MFLMRQNRGNFTNFSIINNFKQYLYMNKHTIIFKTGQLILPDETDLHFVTDLLHAGQLELDYIGASADRQNDHPEEISLLLFHFETQDTLDYDMPESQLNYLLSGLLKKGNPTITTKGNDITVHL